MTDTLDPDTMNRILLEVTSSQSADVPSARTEEEKKFARDILEDMGIGLEVARRAGKKGITLDPVDDCA